MASLRSRLGLSAALVVAAVVSLTTFVLMRLVGHTLETEALDAAAAIALGVSADLADQPEAPSTAELDELLTDYRKAVPAVRSITVVIPNDDGLLVSTELPPPARAAQLGRLALAQAGPISFADGPVGLHFAAVPLVRQHRRIGAVVVAVGMDALRRVQSQAGRAAAVVGVSAVIALVLGLDLVSRRLVYGPLRQLLETMYRAASGDLGTRVEDVRGDELGALATGLNTLLERTAGFNDTLRAEVEHATAGLRAANRELLETAQRLFALRRELARSQRLALAGQMAASLAHQIGTPLNVISGHAQLLLAELPADAPHAARLRTMREQVERVAAIVQALLDRARRPELDLRPLAPGPLIERLAELVRPLLLDRPIELEVELEADLPAVPVDAEQLEQALLNLVTNALDAMPEGGRLCLGARREGAGLACFVSDTGCGIAAEALPRVFEPLFTTKPPGRGTGLGLPIAREIAAAHGGTVQLDSRPGAGTTALLVLPIAREGH